MSVLHIISSIDPQKGGVAQAVRTMIKELGKMGHIHEVVTIDDPALKFDSGDDFIVHKVGPGRTPWLYSLALRRWLDEHAKRFDTMIVHGLWQYHTYAVLRAWRRNNRRSRLFVMPHGMLDPYFQRASGRKLKAIRNKIVWLLNEKKIINNCDGLLFTCDMERELAKESFAGYAVKKTYVIGLGIEEAVPYNASMSKLFLGICKGLPQKTRYFLFLGRIDPKKGVDMLINAYRKLMNEYEDMPALVIAGPGLDTEYGQTIRKGIKDSEMIFFPGMLNGDAKWGALYGAELFILPSHQENFGIAIVESLACGVPVLITNKVNIWKEIASGGGGMIINDTEQDCEEALRRWMVKERSEMLIVANQARKTFLHNFSISEFTNKVLQILNKKEKGEKNA
ncbi:MAG: glycosyltransferase [Sphingobacteriales bacterium]|nr:glycosyltransferase [Sphingobacteriales bacterium]OJV97398.1 MAG: hypothetical protein BGO52_08895 [Sphingobacteriales bacterium 44-61]